MMTSPVQSQPAADLLDELPVDGTPRASPRDTKRPADRQRKRQIFDTGVALAAVLVPVLVMANPAQGGPLWAASVLGCCVAPIVVATAITAAGPRLVPVPAVLVALGFAVFFGAGAISYAFDFVSIIGRGDPPANRVLWLIASSSLVTSCFVGAMRRTARSQVVRVRQRSAEDRTILYSAHLLTALALAGAALTIVRLGGIDAAQAALRLHVRGTLVAAGAGGSMWGIFALPALIMTFSALISPMTASTLTRWLLATEFVVTIFVAISVFGSRLLAALALVGCVAAFYRLNLARPRALMLAAVAVVFLGFSAAVLQDRAAQQGQSNEASLVQMLSYSILDIGIAADHASEELRPQFRSLDRAGQALTAGLPGGARADGVSDSRIDVIVVKSIGTEAQQRSSGTPPSLPVFLIIGFGPAFGCVFAVLLGMALGRIERSLTQHPSDYTVPMFGLWAAFVFNAFKDGDLAINIATELKRWVYVGVVVFAVAIIHRRRGNGAAFVAATSA